MKLFKSTPKITYGYTYLATPNKAMREVLFVECPNLSREYLQHTIVDKRPLFDWYAEHLAKRFKAVEDNIDREEYDFICLEIQRLNLCNTILLYDNMSDDENRMECK